MSEFAQDIQQSQQQQSQVIDANASTGSHDDLQCRTAGSQRAKPDDRVLTSWMDGYNKPYPDSIAAATPRFAQPARDRQAQGPVVPPGFDVPILSATCFPPPAAMDWSNVPAIATSPTHMITGKPGFKPQFASDDFDPYKVAFTSSWNELKTSYNGLVTLHREMKSNERVVVPILQVGASRSVGAPAQGIDASRSFVGGKLKPSLTKIDSAKFSPALRGQILQEQEKLKATELDIAMKRNGIADANSSLIQAANRVEIATNNVEITKSTTEIDKLQLDENQVRRELEDFKAKVKVSVESTKLVVSIIGSFADPLKVFTNVSNAISQGAVTGGAAAEAVRTIDTNAKIASLDGQIRSLKGYKGHLLEKNARIELENAILDMEKALNGAKNAVRVLEAAKIARSKSYRDMSTLIEKAGMASGLNPRDQHAAAAAVEAMPKIEMIRDQLQRMDEILQSPRYTAASGIGAAMSSNLDVFTHALSVLRGNREYVSELRALWGARHAAVSSLVDQTTSDGGNGGNE